jgi:hypothetical protein
MPQITCQFCGRANEITVAKPASAYGVPWTPMRPMADSAQRPRYGDVAQAQVQAEPEFKEATRDTPARPPSDEADFLVPFKRSAVTGLVFGGAIGFGIGIKTPDVPFGEDILWTGVIVLTTFGLAWLFFMARSDSTLWIRERIINRDLDNDGHIGAIRVEAHLHREDDEEEHWDLARLPAPSWELLQEFAKDVLNEHTQITFSERGAARYGYSQEMFRDLRDRFVEAGWARWRNPAHHEQGAALLVGGKAILRNIAGGDAK